MRRRTPRLPAWPSRMARATASASAAACFRCLPESCYLLFDSFSHGLNLGRQNLAGAKLRAALSTLSHLMLSSSETSVQLKVIFCLLPYISCNMLQMCCALMPWTKRSTRIKTFLRCCGTGCRDRHSWPQQLSMKLAARAVDSAATDLLVRLRPGLRLPDLTTSHAMVVPSIEHPAPSEPGSSSWMGHAYSSVGPGGNSWCYCV